MRRSGLLSRFWTALRSLGRTWASLYLDGPRDVVYLPMGIPDAGFPFVYIEDAKQPLHRASAIGSSKDPPPWYSDLDIYQLQVRTFYDSNADGIGDFAGLVEKIPYIRDLGVDAVWLLPIFPSPMRDGGYDISDFRSVHPELGTMDDFKAFLERAHGAGLRVLLDLVLNHTSDRHPWFQSARRGPASPHHDWYVWSPTPDRYKGVRVIFNDTETSNWTLDPECGKYYWHRFFSHQPDLNYDNPDVVREMLDVARFWFDLGVDGFRVDAAPYLYEREGTACEGLPETHAFLKQLRAVADSYSPPRVLLAEANQRPEQLMPYFGEGDEFHMAFHFPLMPRLFMAVRREEASVLDDVLRTTPPPPPGCQWAMFLRNHDELTLETVRPEERSYMLEAFAERPEMRLNLGIRRRLWPLMMGGRRQIELLHGLILGLPGGAVFYYGDEIGMGDDVRLDDRRGVRTPMQWTGGLNAGFSAADPSKLEAPLITTPDYHYAGANVEALESRPTSFLHWFRRVVKAHRTLRAFRGGSITPVRVDNRRIVAFVREGGGETVLCVYNLSRFVQSAMLDLSSWPGRSPAEVFGGGSFPTTCADPYFLSLGPHAFYWLRLDETKRGGKAAPVRRDRTILFVCHFNSVRSQVAEALAASIAAPGVRLLSAGLEKSVVNVDVVKALEEMGVDAQGLFSKTLEEVASEHVDDVVVLAEEAWLPGARMFPYAAHHFWPVADPVAIPGRADVPLAIRKLRDGMAERIKQWFRMEGLCR